MQNHAKDMHVALLMFLFTFCFVFPFGVDGDIFGKGSNKDALVHVLDPVSSM